MAAGVVWGAVSVLSMTYGTLLNWPDYVHTDYGFPMAFATHTSSTIAGPADTWSVDLVALTGDLTFWFIGMLAILVATTLLQWRSEPSDHTSF